MDTDGPRAVALYTGDGNAPEVDELRVEFERLMCMIESDAKEISVNQGDAELGSAHLAERRIWA